MSSPGTYRTATIIGVVLTLELISCVVFALLYTWADTALPQFRMERPQELWAMLICPVLTLLFCIGIWSRNRSLRKFSDVHLLKPMVRGISSWRTAIRFLLVRHGLAFVLFAMAGPQMGTRLEEVKAQGIDVVVAVDVSNSMLAEDLRPNRMEVAKRALEQVVDRMKGDRLGIVVFAGEAFVQLPITADRSAAKLFLASIGPDLVGTQGTAIGAAITTAAQCFRPEDKHGKAIIVISDGESFEDDGGAAARKAQEQGITVHTIGLGSPSGAPIPERRGDQVIGFKKDREGRTVMTRLDQATLESIANAGKGSYSLARAGDNGIERIIAQLRTMDQAELGSVVVTGHEDRYTNFLFIGLLLLIPGLLLGEKRPATNPIHLPWNA